MTLSNRYTLIIFIMLHYILAGCSMVGPTAVSNSRVDYNLVLGKTNNEQLLLNLVRLRYRDIPFFMETVSLSTGFSFKTDLTTSFTLTPSQADVYDITGPGVAYEEKPTITYKPLQGEQFVTELLSPLNLGIIMLLYHSGWSIERLLRVTTQNINKIANAPTASGPTPDTVPKYKHFQKIASLFRTLQQKDALIIAQGSERDKFFIVIPPKHQNSSDVQEFLHSLNLNPNQSQFELVHSLNFGDENNQIVSIRTRSLLASMYYLSQAVEIPQHDQKAGRVTLTRYDSGELFDWNNVTRDLFRVHSSSSHPKNAYIAVKYRGTWFYVDDSDLNSKSTFSLLAQLSALQSGETQSEAPVLTIPVQ